MANLMALKSDHKWCETIPIRPIIASHLLVRPFWATTFPINHLGSHKNHYAPSLVHHCWSLTALGISTLVNQVLIEDPLMTQQIERFLYFFIIYYNHYGGECELHC